MNGKPLSAPERVAAAMLFYFQAGLDARLALSDGARSVSVPSPSEEDLRTIADETPIARWRSVLPVAEELVQGAVATADRDPLDVARDVANTVRRGQRFIEKITHGGAGTIAEAVASSARTSARKGRA